MLVESLERAAAKNLRDYVTAYQQAAPEIGAVAMECAGGVAAYTGTGSPLTTVKGAGPEIGDRDIDEAGAFFRGCGVSGVTFELAPWVTDATIAKLTGRGFEVTGDESVVVRRLPCQAAVPRHAISALDFEQFAALMAEVFELPDEPRWRHMTRSAALLPGALNLGVRDETLGWIGCAQLAPAGGVAILGNDGTLPAARGRGVQKALIEERLRRATELGFLWVAAEVAPGSVSEANYLRCGFEIAYARSHYTRR
jgi:GNAT superfamily N-acetyltransferase